MGNEIRYSLENHKDFCYETNFNSTPLFWSEKFRESGYELNLVFFCLDSISEAKRRVQIRVENGGHYVPEHEIINRYNAGYLNLDNNFQYFDNVHLLNSSYYNLEPRHILSIREGEIIATTHLPKFLCNLIPNILRLV